MNIVRKLVAASAVVVTALASGCATWHDMDRSEKGLAAGATGGAVVGGVIGGPIGAAVGAGVGGYAGHHEASNGERLTRASVWYRPEGARADQRFLRH